MKKFGFKKSKGEDDSSKGTHSGAASAKSSNPYAAMGTGGNDPYAPKSSAPPAYDGGMSDYRRDKSPVPPGGYGGAPQGGSRYGNSGVSDSGSRYGNSGPNYGEQGGYGSNRFGDSQQGGYGSDRYGSSGTQESMQAKRPGGYGGMGTSPSPSTQEAPSRYKPPPAQTPETEENGADGGYGSRPGGYGSTNGGYGNGGDSQGYGGYGDRELTQEEQEEEDINATVWYLVAALALQWLLIAE